MEPIAYQSVVDDKQPKRAYNLREDFTDAQNKAGEKTMDGQHTCVVIQGPPGTGKSTTNQGIICEAVQNGLKVSTTEAFRYSIKHGMMHSAVPLLHL